MNDHRASRQKRMPRRVKGVGATVFVNKLHQDLYQGDRAWKAMLECVCDAYRNVVCIPAVLLGRVTWLC